MSDYRLQILKASLCLLSTDEAQQEYLEHLLRVSEEDLNNKGITDDGGDAYTNAVVQYACWLYNRRNSQSKEAMPASLRYALNNAWVSSNLPTDKGGASQ